MLDQNDIKLLRELLEEDRKAAAEESARYVDTLYETKIEPRFRQLEESQKAAVEESVERSIRYMDMLYETKIEPQFRLLAEGHETLLQTLAPRNRVEEPAEEVSFLKTVVAAMNREINELKQAI